MLFEHPGARPQVDPTAYAAPTAVYGVPRSATARERLERQTAWLGAHRDDRRLNAAPD